MNIGAKVYRMALNSSASHGDTDLEWIHTGEEVVRHSDYEIALKRILEIEEQVRVRGERMEEIYRYSRKFKYSLPADWLSWFDENGKVRDD